MDVMNLANYLVNTKNPSTLIMMRPSIVYKIFWRAKFVSNLSPVKPKGVAIATDLSEFRFL